MIKLLLLTALSLSSILSVRAAGLQGSNSSTPIVLSFSDSSIKDELASDENHDDKRNSRAYLA